MEIYKSVEIILDACTYFKDKKTKKLIDKISEFNLNDEDILFLLKYQFANKIDVQKENLIYYLFKFKTDVENLNNRGNMLGVSGGYIKGKLTTKSTNIVFSEFETVEDDYKTQGNKLIEFIQNLQKNY